MIRGVLFDLDGTLYRQGPLRALMATELATVPWLQSPPWRATRVWRILHAFREVREELRALGRPDQPLDRLQYSRAAERLGIPAGDLEAVVAEWILRRPLKYLRHVSRPGTRALFEQLAGHSVEVGVFSDYPVRDKLAALGLADLVPLTLEATAEDVNAFKPHPRGFLQACERWGCRPDEVLYVGDRPDVDAAGAAAAGMPCVIVGGRPGDGYVLARTMTGVLDVALRDHASGRSDV